MTGLTPFFITGYSQGLMNSKKPFLLPDQAWSTLQNLYVFRERVKKREGLKFIGRLARNLTGINLGTTPGAQTTITFNTIFSSASPMIPGSTNEIQPGSLVITIGAPDAATFTDLGNGNFSVTGAGLAAGSYVNYATGLVVLNFIAPTTGGAAITATFTYYPSIPVMGIASRDTSMFNSAQTIWFDRVYAYDWSGTGFEEFLGPGATWNSSDSDFFWWFNYRGLTDNKRVLFVTNFKNDAQDPMRYFTDGAGAWVSFLPQVDATNVIWTGKIIIAYYGRLLIMNTWEGNGSNPQNSAVNFFNRVRWCGYSLDPTDVANSWKIVNASGQITTAGFLDAPTNEAIISAVFIRNTLVVTFEQTTWQLRYLGEYGSPFIWERVSSDLGSESTFSTVLFDNHMLAVGDKAIIAANGNTVDRIDLDIPNQVFIFKNANFGTERVFGIRNYQKEVVYWNYPDSQTDPNQVFPNKVLLYNYRNGTWAIFRDSVTAFGSFLTPANVTWDSNDVTWDSATVTWDDFQSQSMFPGITSGNQQGFVSFYQEDNGLGSSSPIQEEPSLSITGVNLGVTPITFTVTNHNLIEGEIIYVTGMLFIDSNTFLPITTTLNNQFYQVQIVDANTIQLYMWDFTNEEYGNNFTFTPTSNFIYVGNGQITLIPKIDGISKDINIFQSTGIQTKLSRLDMLMEPSADSAITINLITNARKIANPTLPTADEKPVWSSTMSTVLTPPFYVQESEYAWFRLYATLAAQYFRIQITLDDNLMNTLSTHSAPCTLLAINAWCREGGKIVF
jgi:hypothetical protein